MIGNYQSALHNIPEERRTHLHRVGYLKSRKFLILNAVRARQLGTEDTFFASPEA